MMCTPTSHGATGGKIPSFPTASASKSLRLEYGYSGHHTETDHVIRSGSLDCRRVAIRPPQPARARASTDVRTKMWGVSGTEASSSDFSRVKAFRVHESHNSRRHASEVTNHASRATGLCTCRVRARPDRATQHTCAQSTEITHSTKIH